MVTLDGGSTATLFPSGIVEIRGSYADGNFCSFWRFSAFYGGNYSSAVAVRGTDMVRSDGFSVMATSRELQANPLWLGLLPATAGGIVVQVKLGRPTA